MRRRLVEKELDEGKGGREMIFPPHTPYRTAGVKRVVSSLPSCPVYDHDGGLVHG